MFRNITPKRLFVIRSSHLRNPWKPKRFYSSPSTSASTYSFTATLSNKDTTEIVFALSMISPRTEFTNRSHTEGKLLHKFMEEQRAIFAKNFLSFADESGFKNMVNASSDFTSNDASTDKKTKIPTLLVL